MQSRLNRLGYFWRAVLLFTIAGIVAGAGADIHGRANFDPEFLIEGAMRGKEEAAIPLVAIVGGLLLGGPALDQLAVRAAAAVDLEVGAAVLEGSAGVRVGDEAALAHRPRLAVGADPQVDGTEESAGGLGGELAAHGPVDGALREVPLVGG
jgi:hypothetical protein